MKKVFYIIPPVALALLISCNGGALNRQASKTDNVSLEMAALPNVSPAPADIPLDRKIIREGNLTLLVSDIKETRTYITSVTADLKGYVAGESANSYMERSEQTMSLRVPAENFDRLVSLVSEKALKVDNRSITSEDVTGEYIDVEARIKTKKELETRYLELLKKANTVENILAIEAEANKLRTEIESAEGRLKYLKDKVAMSSLTVTFYEKPVSKFGFFPKMGHALEAGWKGLLWFLIGVVSIWPFILILTGGIWFAVWYSKRRKKND